MRRTTFATLLLALLLAVVPALAPSAVAAGSGPRRGATAAAVDAAVEAILALPYTPAHVPQGTDAAFGADDWPAAFPLTDTADSSCCVGPVPDQPALADLAPPFADFPAAFDRIQLTSPDGTPLHAHVAIIPGAPGIVVNQGFNTNGRWSVVRYGAFLAANGYSVIVPDHRDMGREWARGGSWDPSGERRGQTLGWKEAQDFLVAAAELRRRGAPAVGMLGFSEGAQNAMLAMGIDHDGLLDAVMTFSGPADQATQGSRNPAATAALLTTVVSNPDLCGYLAEVGVGEEFSASPNFMLRHASAIDTFDGIIGGAAVDGVPAVHFYAQDDTLVLPYHATLLASRTNAMDTHRTVLIPSGNHAYFTDRWWTQAAVLEWFGTWLDPDGLTGAVPTVAQTPGGVPLAQQVIDTSEVTRAEGDAERSPVDACPAEEEPIGPTPLVDVTVTGPRSVRVDARGSWSGWEDHRVVSWTVDLGDGTVADGPVVDHTYDTAGARSVTVTVADDTGRTVTVEVPVELPGVVERVAGEDRLATALAVSRAAFTAADTVVLASAGSFADALAAAPRAFQLGSPVLLVGDVVEADLLAELARLRALRVLLVGGEAAIPAGVAEALTAEGYGVDRLAGEDRYATAAAVARAVGDASRRAVVASGADFPDAVSAAALAARGGMPLLLVGPDEVPAVTAAALADLAVEEVVLVGGPAAVSEDVAVALAGTDRAVRRLAGPDRHATSVAVAEAGVGLGLHPARTWVATGTDFPDALTVGAAAAGAGEAVLLVDGRSGPGTVTACWLASSGVERVVVAGGASAVSGSVAAGLAGVVEQGPPGGC